MALEDTRLPGENAADILTQANTHMRDMMTTRCQIGTANDKDNGMPVSIALSSPVGQCVTAGGTAAKVVSVSNFADFELQSGIEISVYFANANTANNPTLNVGGTGAIPITVQGLASNVSVGAGCFKTGIYNFKYIDITVSGTRIQQWLLLNGGIAEQTADYTKYGDGTLVHTRNTDFITLLSDNNVFVNYKIQDGIIFVNSVSLGGLMLNENAYTEIAQIPNYNRTLDVYFPVNSLGGSAICYGRINASGLIEIYSNSATSYFSFTAITY